MKPTKNKKRIDPRYFLEETVDEETPEAVNNLEEGNVKGEKRPGIANPWDIPDDDPLPSSAKYRLQDPHRGKKGSGMVNPKWDNKTKVAVERLRAAQKEMAKLLKKAMDDAAMRPTSSIEAIWYAHDSMDEQQDIIMDIITGLTGRRTNTPGGRGGSMFGTAAGRQAAKKLKKPVPPPGEGGMPK